MDDASRPPMSLGLNLRLSAMFFLQYAIWGAWLPLLGSFLFNHRGFDGGDIGLIFSMAGVGAIVAPFVAGQIADRYFATQKFLGISHILGAVLVWFLASVTGFWAFFAFSLFYSLIYSPTLALTNSLAFHHVPDRDRDFGRVRVWGTVGWIVVGVSIGQWLLHAHTISDDDASRQFISEQILDDDARRDLVEQSVITLADESVVTGMARESETGGLIVTVEGDDGPEERTIEAGEIGTILPKYATFAADGKAEEIREAIRQLDDGEATADPVISRLTAGVLNDDALKPYIQAGHWAGIADAFRLSSVLGALMGVFCFFLPNTPPAPREKQKSSFATTEALREIRKNPLLTLFLLAIPVSCIHQFYFVHTADFLGRFQSDAADAINAIFGVGGGGLMTLGQVSEILVLALIPFVAKRVSRKLLLGVGLVAYALRMAAFGYVDQIAGATGIPDLAIVIPGVLMHGLCFGCFIFVSFLVVDEETTGDVRATAQSLYNLVIFGVGIIVGSMVAGWVANWADAGAARDYTKLFSVPMWGALACLLILLVAYPRKSPPGSRGPSEQPVEP